MAKAHALIAKYNVDLLRRSKNRQFSSVFVGSPALRHFREDYHLAGLLQDFYFVHGIWVSAYVLAKGKMGRVLEISGTRPNLKIACYVHDFVRNLVNTQWDAYNHRKGLNRYRKTDFAVGIIEGLRSKLGAQHGKDHHQNEPSALVKIQDPSLKHYLAYKYPRTSRIQRRASSQDDAVLNDGMRIGKKAVIYKGISEKNKSSRLLTSG
jgi:hypothetical protein